jgi:hypothetical protein
VVEITMTPQQNRIIVRVMDYDWYKKEDLLGTGRHFDSE